MVLPFVRELLADVEKSQVFRRTTSHLKSRAGRRRVSGLTNSAKALHLPLFAAGASAPLIVIVENNRAAEEMLPVLPLPTLILLRVSGFLHQYWPWIILGLVAAGGEAYAILG